MEYLLGLEYLLNGDEYGSLENSLKVREKNAEHGGQPEILAPVHRETNHCSLIKTWIKALYLENFY